MGVLSIFLFVLIPVFVIVGLYRLLARLTSKRATKHGIQPPEEGERRKQRIFFDE